MNVIDITRIPDKDAADVISNIATVPFGNPNPYKG